MVLVCLGSLQLKTLFPFVSFRGENTFVFSSVLREGKLPYPPPSTKQKSLQIGGSQELRFNPPTLKLSKECCNLEKSPAHRAVSLP